MNVLPFFNFKKSKFSIIYDICCSGFVWAIFPTETKLEESKYLSSFLVECHQRTTVFNVPSNASFLMKERYSAQRTLFDHSSTIPWPSLDHSLLTIFWDPTAENMKSSLAWHSMSLMNSKCSQLMISRWKG